MAKLYFYYGAMNSSKSAQLIMTVHNYKEKNQKVVAFKPIIDNREGEQAIIKSRIGIFTENVILFDEVLNLWDEITNSSVDMKCILVDEAQFLTKKQVVQLSDLVDEYNIPVMCYGLRTNFKGELFEGSKWLFAYADTIEEIKTICFCGKKAIFNARIEDGCITKNGEEILIGGNNTYISLCRGHWKKGIIEGQKEI
jgi:thymidine kinase